LKLEAQETKELENLAMRQIMGKYCEEDAEKALKRQVRGGERRGRRE
jgi:hypothetical protein